MTNLKELIPIYQRVEEENYPFTFTVFTPVYNCEKTIKNVHKSLINQTYKNFEWLIINDGSTDASHNIINDLIKTTPLNVHYIHNIENQHKMGCFIQAISLAKGDLLLTFDGDDECMPDALNIFHEEYINVPNNLKDKIVAVTGLCQDQFGNLVGDKYPTDPYYSNTFESQFVDGIHDEKWGFTKTTILKGIRFNDQIISKGLIPESIVWNLIAKEGYLTRYINKILRIYHVDVENSLSTISVEKRAFGSAINSIAAFNWFYTAYLFKAPKFFLKNLYVLLRASKFLPYKLNDYLKAIDSKFVKVILVASWPFRKLTT